MKIVVLDGYTENPGDLSWGGFEAIGETVVYDRTPGDQIVERIGDAEIVILNKTPITRATLEACPGIKYIGVLATGYNVVDTDAARERGIPVCNIPSYGTASVGQFAIALLLEICHHIGAHSDSVHNGDWERSADWCYWNHPLIELDGKTMGIIGFGRIGQATGRIAKALGMKVIAYDTHPSDAGRALAGYVELDTLLATSDVIALHCPLFPETQGIIDRAAIAKMKDGVIILNNSRGPLIVEQDLADALDSGKVAAAGLDVVSTEPIRGDNPLLKAKNCIITPHISWAAREPRQRIMDMAVENLKAFLGGGAVNVVNSTHS
ncbi:MAG: D-2-hydroxyacid dehydrogenase [Angelakisella sp.]|jgi:glycerate dehydrogenase|nr:D-2-hydroxyacid dehydrogenase [Angelakisella sp.]